MATLVLHERIHPKEDSPSNCHWRQSSCLSKSHRLFASLTNTFQKWLPNQLFGVYDQMTEVEDAIGGLPECRDILDLVHSQRKTLQKEVDKYCSERSV